MYLRKTRYRQGWSWKTVIARCGAMAESLIARQLAWGHRRFSRRLSVEELVLQLSPEAEANIGDKLNMVSLKAVQTAPDLMAVNPAAEEDDIGINRLVTLDHNYRIVFKKVRSHRVPTIYHEPFVAEIIGQAGLTTLEYLGAASGADGSQWILTRHLKDYVSLRDLLRGLKSGSPERLSRESGHLNYSLYSLGLSVRRLIQAGIEYADLDFKNALVHRRNSLPIIFCDFERTRILGGEPREVAQRLVTPIARRLKREGVGNKLVQLMTAGAFSYPVSIDVTNLATWLASLIRPAGSPPLTVAIDGMAGAGKTVLATALTRELERLGHRPVALETDWFIRYTRSERSAEFFTVPHTEWYDLPLLHTSLHEVRKGNSRPFTSPLYDHRTGRHSFSPQVIEGAEVILLEGMYAGSRLFSDAVDLAIHVAAAPGVASRRFRNRDRMRASTNAAQAISRERQINSAASRASMACARTSAHLVLDGGAGPKYRIIGSRPELVSALLNYAILEKTEGSSQSCWLCPGSGLAANRFHAEGNCQAVYHPDPEVKGHMLVAPLRHFNSLNELDDAARAELLAYSFEITRSVVEEVGAKRFDWILQDDTRAVSKASHLHIQVLPRRY